MNERILELARQVWPDPNVSHVNHEKFAQLIVQECVDIISPYTVRMGRPGEEYLHPILEIQEHFKDK